MWERKPTPAVSRLCCRKAKSANSYANRIWAYSMFHKLPISYCQYSEIGNTFKNCCFLASFEKNWKMKHHQPCILTGQQSTRSGQRLPLPAGACLLPVVQAQLLLPILLTPRPCATYQLGLHSRQAVLFFLLKSNGK